MYGSILALGGLATATALYMQKSNQENVAEAGEGVTEIQIPFGDSLKEGEMRVLKVGEAND